MSHAADRAALRDDQLRLRRMLKRTVGTVSAASLALPRDQVAILDVACGACDEAETLSDFFQEWRSGPGQRPPSVRLLGTDVRERELDEARARFRSRPGRAYGFFRGDASRLAAHRELPDDFDVLVLRHQNLYHGRLLWQKIFDQGMARLKDDGLIVLTSYFDREHALALEAFRGQGAEVLITERNLHSRSLPTPGKSVDRHVAVLRKSNPK